MTRKKIVTLILIFVAVDAIVATIYLMKRNADHAAPTASAPAETPPPAVNALNNAFGKPTETPEPPKAPLNTNPFFAAPAGQPAASPETPPAPQTAPTEQPSGQ